ncbi:Phosphate transport system permease protein pstA [Slackia heliotrinireducens]|nr:ABC transporter permease subunit [Slackia heliotrinireducens]VEH03475.1 Phosphate transport system permease protein pstA [Slackia heliotrinireducens]
MLAFIQLMGLKAGILVGGLTLVVMVLPTIISNTLESLKTVPDSYREGALALGSGKWHMIRTVVLPSSIDGIVTGCILAVGRIVGESAALLYTAGFGLILNSFMTALQSSSATLTVALYVYATERGELNVAFSIATILLILTLLLNLAANVSASKLNNKEK